MLLSHGSGGCPLLSKRRPRARGPTDRRLALQASAVPTARFSDGSPTEFSAILNGCWTLAGGHGRAVFDGPEAMLGAHADAGFTTFDTADIYGPSEGIIGRFRAARGEGSAVQVFTKYVPNIFRGGAPSRSAVEAAVKRSAEALMLPKLDLIQLHWWDYGVKGMIDVGLALAELRESGLITSVGVTNLNVDAVEKLLQAGVPLVSNQVQMSLLDRRPVDGGMVQLCKERRLKVLTYGSLAGGLLTDRYVEEPRKNLLGGEKYSNVDLNTSSLKMYWQVVRMFGGQEAWRRLLQVMRSVADRHNGASVANVALRWAMAQGGGDVVHPIVGIRGAANIQDNLKVFTLELDDDDFAALDEVVSTANGPSGDVYSFERGG